MDRTNPPADPGLYRKAVSLFPTGIVVVTAETPDGAIHGMTVNSFTSISLDPPTVMVSLRPGRARGLISRNGWYGISVLTDGQRSCSSHFSRQRDVAPEVDFEPGHRVATIKGSLARFECEVMREVTVHDHTLFFARVASCTAAEGTPLVYFASRDGHVLQVAS